MNYRHRFHAGNFADVMKHVLLVQLVRGLQKKPGGALFLDTHAGRGRYDLEEASQGDSLARKPEHPGGIGRLWTAPGLPKPLVDYLELVKHFQSDQLLAGGSSGPRFYPGSPRLLKLLARGQDRLALWERHPDEVAALKEEFHKEKRVAIQEGDGYGALRALLPPPERRGLVLIDPPFEDQDEGERIAKALEDGLLRFPSGLYAIWYPLTGRSGISAFLRRIQTLRLPPTLAVELTVKPDVPGMGGCGLLVVNPPWKFADEVNEILEPLAQLLGQGPGANARLTWLVPE